jgi:hypothetical protein
VLCGVDPCAVEFCELWDNVSVVSAAAKPRRFSLVTPTWSILSLRTPCQRIVNSSIGMRCLQQKGWSPLRHSVESRSLITTNMLLERGADIDLRDKQGVSPLTAVIRRQLTTQLEIFINHYALVSHPTRLDFVGAVLLESVDLDAFEVVEFLLKDCAFASVEFQNESGESAFHLAKSRRVVELLAEYDTGWTAFRARTTRHDSCIHYAVRRPGEAGRHVLRALLDLLARMQNDQTVELGADAVSQLLGANGECVTPLYEAAMHLVETSIHRSAKCALLLAHDAPLFPETMQLWHSRTDPADEQSLVTMTAPVRACLRRWLCSARVDDNRTPPDGEVGGDRDGEWDRDMLALCSHWLGCVDFDKRHSKPRHQHAGPSSLVSDEVLGFVAFSGYAHNVMSLLLELPLRLSGVRGFLAALRALVQAEAHQQQTHAALLRLLATDMITRLNAVELQSRP